MMRIRSAGARSVVAAAFLAVTVWGGAGIAAADGPGRAPGAVVASEGPAPVVPPPAPVMQRRVDVVMTDYEFSPVALDVKLGETISFVFTNSGKEVHDAFIGDQAAQEEHEQQMRESEGGHDHAHAGGVTVPPGEKGALRHQFDRPGTFEIGCHRPGHYVVGMKVLINVSAV